MNFYQMKFTHIFEGKTLTFAWHRGVRTYEVKRFSPLPDKNISFYFKACHTERLRSAYGPDSEFLLTLIRSPDSESYPSLVMSIDASVYYHSGHLFKKYETRSNIKVDDLDFLDFENVTNASRDFIVSHTKMRSGNLTLHCKMTFTGEIPQIALKKNVKNSSPNFSDNLKCVYESAVFNDFVFKVGDKSFPVHKVILVAHSSVLMKMLTHDFEESKTNSVTITDTTPENFEMFLKYLYSGKIEDESWVPVKELYCLADKYDVGILKDDCVDIAIALLSIDLVCDILKLAYLYDDNRIKSAAKKFSVDHVKKLLSREDWNELVALHPIIGYEVMVNFAPS